MNVRLKKFSLSLAVIVGFLGFAFRQRHGDDARAIVPNPSTSGQSSSTPASDNINSVSAPPIDTNTSFNENTNQDAGPTVTTPPTPTPQPTTGQYRNGSYIGSVADAFYGNLQVRAMISGGKITDVVFLEYPKDRNTSIFINSQAMPLLKQEAIQAQSANISGVSGASASSQAFVQSLDSALSQAHV